MWLWILALICVLGGMTVAAIGIGKILFLLSERDERDAALARRERLRARGLLN